MGKLNHFLILFIIICLYSCRNEEKFFRPVSSLETVNYLCNQEYILRVSMCENNSNKLELYRQSEFIGGIHYIHDIPFLVDSFSGNDISLLYLYDNYYGHKSTILNSSNSPTKIGHLKIKYSFLDISKFAGHDEIVIDSININNELRVHFYRNDSIVYVSDLNQLFFKKDIIEARIREKDKMINTDIIPTSGISTNKILSEIQEQINN